MEPHATGTVEVNGITIAYETIGDPTAVPVLLIMGLGAQLITWPDELCAELVDRGTYVIRFDNRDAGRSTHLTGQPAPRPLRSVLRLQRPPYRIEDMADDAAGLLAALGIDSAHVVGASMGGFIAQTVALRHPARVRSLTLIMTSTGSLLVGLPKGPVLLRGGRQQAARERDGAIESSLATSRAIGSPGYPFDEGYRRELAGRAYDRGYDFDGYLRQFAAIGAQSDRTRALSRVRVPTVVLHGLSDPLVSQSGGRAVAQAIPGSRFVGYPGMGHDLPRDLWPQFVDEMATVIRAGEERRAGELEGASRPA
jgi:pimeloyl-ACP methyl ester carboxylesterase